MLLKLIQRLRRKPPVDPDLLRFGRDVREVMGARISRAMAGTLSPAEARRMVVEKHSAAVRAQLAYVRALLNGTPAAGRREVFAIYDQAVQSNRKRLRRRRWGWPGAKGEPQ
jgi:hypothetical protein